MTNYLGIATATAALGQRIAEALQAVPRLSAAPEVRIGRPGQDHGFVGANLLLVRAVPSPFRRNEDLATRDAAGTLVRRPQAALDLEYLISFYGSDTGLEPARMMGSVIANLHAQPILTAAQIRATIAGGTGDGVLAGSDLDTQPEPLRLTLAPLDLEHMHRVWALFPQVSFAPSLIYTASTLMLSPDLMPARALPVRSAAFSASPTLGPRIESVEPAAIPFGKPGQITLRGANLSDSTIQAWFGAYKGQKLVQREDGGLTVTVPEQLPAGANSVSVSIPKLLPDGSPDPDGSSVSSPDFPFILQPRLAEGAVCKVSDDPRGGAKLAILSCALAPMPLLSQPVQLFLNPMPGSPPPAQAYSAAALRCSLDPNLATGLDKGPVSAELRAALAAFSLDVATGSPVTVLQVDLLWRVSDSRGMVCRLNLGSDGLQAAFGLAAGYDAGTLAFALPSMPGGNYLLSVQIGDLPAATTPLRRGTKLFDIAASGQKALDGGSLPADLATQLKAQGIPAAGTMVTRPMPSDGWAMTATNGKSLWITPDTGKLAVFALDTSDGAFFGPAVAIPAEALS